MELDPQVSPEEIMSREVELGCESWTSFASSCSVERKVQDLIGNNSPLNRFTSLASKRERRCHIYFCTHVQNKTNDEL